MARWMLVVVVLLGCEGKPKRAADPDPPAKPQASDARLQQPQDGTTAPAASPCNSAKDCVMLCFASTTDCCGDLCGCEHAYAKADAAALTDARTKYCAGRQTDKCDVAKCDASARYWPACVNGACAMVPFTRHTCVNDADCEAFDIAEGECCPDCRLHGWATADLDAYFAWNKQNCAGARCLKECDKLPDVKARCESGQCKAGYEIR